MLNYLCYTRYMDVELTQFIIDQFSKVATKDDLKNFATKDDLKNFATKDDIAVISSAMVSKQDITDLSVELQSEMVTKGEFHSEINVIKDDLSEIKDIVKRLDRRTDEDIRATMKDVEKIKVHLKRQGVTI
jgi:hypothetical protein